ncbi:MAG TPA: ATP-binding protein [Syntrophobacteraceae bacterium]|nr:ATP-binding protein [Syntrophobacteraceae bacterium]
MKPDDFRLMLANGEDRNHEFKASFPWSKKTAGETMARVTKTILAMSNMRDGGTIVIGVAEPIPGTTLWRQIGVSPGDLETFSFDAVADFVRRYAEPAATFNFAIFGFESLKYVEIAVVGFQEVPIICRANYKDILSESAIYVRPRSGRPRSEPVSNFSDMRELLDLAVERGISKFLRMQHVTRRPGLSDEQQFENQIKGF